MKNYDFQMEIFDEKIKNNTPQKEVKVLKKCPGFTDMGDFSFENYLPYKVVRISPTKVIIWNQSSKPIENLVVPMVCDQSLGF